MSRDPIALTIPDLSAFAKALRSGMDSPPSHLEMLGLISRAAGYRNYQHLRARLTETPDEPVDEKSVARAARFFDPERRFIDWPGRTSIQGLCLWVIWAQLPPGQSWTERQISTALDALCTFRDAAQIRRSMIEHGLLRRDRDGSAYERVERKPPPEARALIARILRS
ncbi:DUF2087 domain-containing protein [Mameliella sediminis]|uniref:DUF2087 domain-containing protein n=1 Tax=Mameliella sediminis TaxID=2836866 RepID=UPI001C4614F2|nr:DUF2087 domain-containing protein [Mameliella sediminis]MBY6114745.1 DUF2087 domain-containing protein [Antarctobacter heliothermus]MBY6144318.1 DUF2087 domain-containing protein [Mameliella alba]MBV7392774.1 DUF2087 domain-containing protein [Mameliella sediminis]MBY6161391.1 DUF2087 domain-containing protein [Mameliella alba]MBY6170143.1 DUF2087 domain-containing protein [Mameliella alba]